MTVNSKKMAGVPVRTVSGVGVGKVASMDFDAETGRLTSLRVKVSGAMPGLMGQEAFVAWTQIVSMDEKQVVVADASVPEGMSWMKKRLASPPAHLSSPGS